MHVNVCEYSSVSNIAVCKCMQQIIVWLMCEYYVGKLGNFSIVNRSIPSPHSNSICKKVSSERFPFGICQLIFIQIAWSIVFPICWVSDEILYILGIEHRRLTSVCPYVWQSLSDICEIKWVHLLYDWSFIYRFKSIGESNHSAQSTNILHQYYKLGHKMENIIEYDHSYVNTLPGKLKLLCLVIKTFFFLQFIKFGNMLKLNYKINFMWIKLILMHFVFVIFILFLGHTSGVYIL